jgi:uncharacterized Fe-S cluster-containing protein
MKEMMLSFMYKGTCLLATLDLQALIYKLTEEELLSLGQTWKFIPKHCVKVAAITNAVTFNGGKFTYDEIENKLHEPEESARSSLEKDWPKSEHF